MNNQDYIQLTDHYSAHNYHPLPVVISRSEGVYLWDVEGKRYFDLMAAYSAANHGHCHPELIKTLTAQAAKLNTVSRAFYNDQMAGFLKKACEMTAMDKALPMNSGAEAVETAIKAARRWAYQVKGIAENQAEIIVCHNNFHGRTTTIISFSSDESYRKNFGAYTPGFVEIPFDDANALEKAINKNTAAFLVEPMQGEAGINIPRPGYLKKCAEICRKNNVLLLCDEIQTGLGRTGELLASYHDQVQPDGIMLGKAIGGGILPVSLFLARKEIMDVFNPGSHGSTFGGNALASAIGKRALELIEEEKLVYRSKQLGAYFLAKLQELKSPLIKEIRGRGLFIGIELHPGNISGRKIAEKLAENGVLTKETHENVIRLTPPLVITQEQLDEVFLIIKKTFEAF